MEKKATTEGERRNCPILIIEDEVEVGEMLQVVLRAEGYEVDAAVGIKEAKAALRQRAYGVLIVDLSLPDGDGSSILAVSREAHPLSVPIVLTGYDSIEGAVAALRQGAYDYLAKPCKSERIVSAVNQAAERHRALRAKERQECERAALSRRIGGDDPDTEHEQEHLSNVLLKLVADLSEIMSAQARLLKNVAHEMTNPVSVISGYLEIIRSCEFYEREPESLRNAIANIHENVVMLDSLVRGLREAYYVSDGGPPLEKKSLTAVEELRRAMDDMRFEARAKRLRLDIETDGENNIPVFADRLCLRQMLVNLIGNAIKFSSHGGAVTGRCERVGQMTLFSISDTGPGILPENLERIFEPHFRVPETAAFGRGLGLGLNIVKGLVSMHGGHIWVDSRPGDGATFLFLLPAIEYEAAARRPEMREAEQERSQAWD